jgi:transcriptional regulator with XRE-family HTH domain
MKKQKKAKGVFANRLLQLMQKDNNRFGKHITQEELANGVGITQQTVQTYITGTASPKMDVLVKIAKYFGVSCDYLSGISRAPSLDDSVQAVVNKYGLDEESLHTLSELASTEHVTPDSKHPLDALNVILSDYDVSYDLFTRINHILFGGDYGIMKYYKDDHETGEMSIDADNMRAFLSLSLHICLEDLRDRLPGSKDDTKTTEKPTIKKNGAKKGIN